MLPLRITVLQMDPRGDSGSGPAYTQLLQAPADPHNTQPPRKEGHEKGLSLLAGSSSSGPPSCPLTGSPPTPTGPSWVLPTWMRGPAERSSIGHHQITFALSPTRPSRLIPACLLSLSRGKVTTGNRWQDLSPGKLSQGHSSDQGKC